MLKLSVVLYENYIYNDNKEVEINNTNAKLLFWTQFNVVLNKIEDIINLIQSPREKVISAHDILKEIGNIDSEDFEYKNSLSVVTDQIQLMISKKHVYSNSFILNSFLFILIRNRFTI